MFYDQSKIFNFMEIALKQAQLAFKEQEVPIGAILVKDGNIISQNHNRKEQLNLATAHAEKLVIEEGNLKLNSWRLTGCSLFVTVEPCVMCCGAILQSRIPELYYGTNNTKFGGVNSLYNLLDDRRENHEVKIYPRILERASNNLMKKFFLKIRNKEEEK